MNRSNLATIGAFALSLLLTMAAPTAMAQATLTYPAVADIVAPVTTQFGLYFTEAIKFSLLAVAGFVAWRYMKKTANKV